MFLEIDNEGQVQLRKGAMNIPSVMELYKTDKRNESKPYFNKCITLIYHLYSKEHEFSNLGPKERKDKVANIYLKDEGNIEDYLEKKAFKAVVDDFIDLSYTTTERLYEGIKKSVEHWKLHMANIPMTRKEKYEGQHEIITEIDGIPKGTKINIRTLIEVDNSEEYLKAMKTADSMMDMEEKMAKKVIKEKQLLKNSGEDSMLEEGSFADIINSKRKAQ